MKKLITLLSCTMLAFATSTIAQNYAGMHKQLNIMSDIIKSSVAIQDGRKRSKITGIDSTYLAGQGVVFTISSGSSSRHWGNYNFNFTMSELPPLPPVPPISGRGNDDVHVFESNIDETVSQALETATEGYERAIEAIEENRDIFRDLRNEQRDLAYEVRDLERESRDIEFQMRRANEERKKELVAESKQLAQEKTKLEQARKQLDARVEEMKKQQAQKQQKQAKERITFYQGLTASIAETLCLYGNGLKSLPNSENVSVILKSAGDKVGRRYRDKVFVFSKKDISACSSDKINVAKLLEKGNGYQF